MLAKSSEISAILRRPTTLTSEEQHTAPEKIKQQFRKTLIIDLRRPPCTTGANARRCGISTCHIYRPLHRDLSSTRIQYSRRPVPHRIPTAAHPSLKMHFLQELRCVYRAAREPRLLANPS
ncbi:hypothetical protein VTJ04DRAFT_7850 [Mycothermus thermophilus]|uniref:uncharacterized protein n=1 Tax=Humicola insolens TaxID=85995 RepID=UPI00374335D1